MTTNNSMLTAKGVDFYGPERRTQAEEIKKLLQRTNVLQHGEYNFTPNKLANDVWITSKERDFLTTVPDLGYRSKVSNIDQFGHHFQLNHTNDKIHPSAYQMSATKEDFDRKVSKKVSALEADRVVNWPDMAPQYRNDVTTGQSEYRSSMPGMTETLKPPSHPRLNAARTANSTSDKTKQPIQKRVNFEYGTDGAGFLSENQRMYGRANSATRRAGLDSVTASANDAMERSKQMKQEGTASHVFRQGDYNGIAGDFVSTNSLGYGPRTKPVGLRDGQDKMLSSKPVDLDRTETPNNKLTQFAQENTTPAVFKDAKQGRTYQEAVHFQFGSDPRDLTTVYSSNFVSGSSGNRRPVTQAPQSATKVIQFDPDFAPTGTTCAQVDYSYQPVQLTKMTTFGQFNNDQKNILAHDVSRHAFDRQKSLAHESFKNPPSYFKALTPRRAPKAPWDILETDQALPYSASNKENSEATDNFFGTFMYGSSACDRRFNSRRQCQERVSDGKANHFVIGQGPLDELTETKLQYTGAPKTDNNVPPAGKIEIISKNKFGHLDSSKNTQDLFANDVYKPSIGEPVTRWHGYQRSSQEKAHETSVMKSDFNQPKNRSFTDSQQMRISQCGKFPKEWSKSHLFHTDHTGNNQFVSTAMMDFVKPEIMPGPKRLAAL